MSGLFGFGGRRRQAHGAVLDGDAPLPGPDLPPPDPDGLEKVQGEDDRSIAKDVTVSPWRPLVCLQIYLGDKVGVGSGVLIAPSIVLTAAHNLHMLGAEPGKGRWPSAITAHAGVVNNDRGQAMSRVVRVETCPGYRDHAKTNAAQYEFDFGIARLADDSLFRWAGTVFDIPRQPPMPDDAIMRSMLTVAGYPHQPDEPIRLRFHADRLVTTCNPRTFSYKLDTTRGQSGGPVFCYHADRSCELAGVHVGGDAAVNMARRYDASMQRQVAAWINAPPTGGQAIA